MIALSEYPSKQGPVCWVILNLITISLNMTFQFLKPLEPRDIFVGFVGPRKAYTAACMTFY